MHGIDHSILILSDCLESGKIWNKIFILQEEQMAASNRHILPMHNNASSECLEPQVVAVEMQSPVLTNSTLKKQRNISMSAH
jgi:hypothetical protein